MPIKINLKSALFYAAYALALVCLNKAVDGVPFSVGLCFAMLICGTNIIATPILFAAASAVNLDWISSLISLFAAAFLCAVTYIYRRAHKKIRAEAAAYLSITLAPFIAFSKWKGIDTLYFTTNQYIIRAVAAISVLLFTFFAFRTIYSLIYRLCRCRLRADEYVCIAVFFTLCGLGLYNLCGEIIYVSVSLCIICLAVRFYKSPSALIVAGVVALPCTVATLNVHVITLFILLSVLTLLFCGAGSGAPSAVALATVSAYFYFTGAFSGGAGQIIMRALLLAIAAIVAVIPHESELARLYNLVTVKKILPRTREEQLLSSVSERLYRMSEVFREINCAFLAMDDNFDDGAMRSRMFEELKSDMCAGCKRKSACARTDVHKGFNSLIDAGCIKGRVSLVDLPSTITKNCSEPGVLISKVNKLLADYRRLTVEAENAKNGRRLLANQAKGVSDVLKACAVDVYRGKDDEEEAERAIESELTANGISCPEIRVAGEISITVVGNAPSAMIADCVFKATGKKVILRDKIAYDDSKCALIFVSPPKYDAAFGVAYSVKDGESVSGDTHSVIKINEHSFLMALSDGMGSGEYAKRVSSTAISLIEAFYRAEMPSDIVLETINKLLCFNRDERFTCIDIARIDLNDLSASFIKIGSPAGIIVRKGEIKVLENTSLPLGILDILHPTVCKERLKDGDLVVFMSDGIVSCFPSSTELYEFLQTLKPLNPQSLAEKILSAAKERANSSPDDMTVLCVRIYEKQD